MYILGSSVADDQVGPIADLISSAITELGGSEIVVEQLEKKKLAYPIKKTKNAFYTLVNFDIDSRKVNDLDAKIRAQNSIIRYLLINLEEHIRRGEKDKVIQAKLLANRPARMIAEETEVQDPNKKIAKPAPKPAVSMNSEELEKKIEEALTEDIIK
jgi:small subunit ribosomal protein S6